MSSLRDLNVLPTLQAFYIRNRSNRCNQKLVSHFKMVDLTPTCICIVFLQLRTACVLPVFFQSALNHSLVKWQRELAQMSIHFLIGVQMWVSSGLEPVIFGSNRAIHANKAHRWCTLMSDSLHIINNQQKLIRKMSIYFCFRVNIWMCKLSVTRVKHWCVLFIRISSI
jgi:hypothetical protein